VTTFQSLLDEAKKMQADGLRPHQIVARLGDRANDLGHPIVHAGGLEGDKTLPDNAGVALPNGEAIKFDGKTWTYRSLQP